MGLDMYLYRFNRVGNLGPSDICRANEYFDWREDPAAQKYSLKKWCGVKESELPGADDMEEIACQRDTRYYAWDKERRHPFRSSYEQVAYWRKANEIHKWFVDRVQGGTDDCEFHREVTKGDLKELAAACRDVLLHGVCADGDAVMAVDYEYCRKVLPTQSGFFFGGAEYDKWYVRDLRKTAEVCEELADSTDFDSQMIYYVSSW